MLDTSYRGGSGPGGRQPALHVGPSVSQRSSSWLQSGSQTFPTRAAEVAVSTESSTTTSKTPSREASPGSNNLTHSTTTTHKTTRSISSVHPLPTRIVRPTSPPPTSSLLPTSSNNEATNERPHSILRRTRRQPSDAREEDESEGNSTRRSERRIRFADPVYNNNTSSSSSSSSSSHSTPLVMPSSPHTPVPTMNALGPPQSTGSGGDSSTITTELEEEPALWRAARGTALPYKQQKQQQPKVLLSLPKEELSASDDEDVLHHSTHTATPPRADSQRAKFTSDADIHPRPHVSALDRLDVLVHPSDSSDFSPHNHSAHSQASSSSSAKMMHGKGMTTTTLKEREGSHSGGGGAVEDVTLSALSASSAGTGAHPPLVTPHVTHDAAPDMTSAISDRSSLPSEPSADRATLPQLSSHSTNSDSGTMSSDEDEDNDRARHARRDGIDDRDVSEGVDPTDLHLSDDDEESDGSDMKVSEAHTPPPAQPQSRQGLPERSVTSRASSRVLTSPPSHSSTSSSEEEDKDKAKHVKDGKATHDHRHHHKNADEKLVVLVRKDNLTSGAHERDAEVQLSVLPIEQAAELLGRSAESLKKLMGKKETEEEEEEERVALRRALRTSASRSPSREHHHSSPAVSHLTDAAAHNTNEEEEEGGAIRNALFDRSPTQLLTMHMNLFPKLPSVNGSAGRVPSSYFSSYTTTNSTTMIQADMNGNGGAVAGSRQSSTEAAALDAAPSNLVQRLLQSSTPRGTNSTKESDDRSSKASRTVPSASQAEGRQDGMVNGMPVWMARPVMRAAVPLVSHPLQTTHNTSDKKKEKNKKGDHSDVKQTGMEESQRNKTTRTATPTPPRPTTTTIRKDADSEDGAQVAEYVLLSPRPDKAIQNTPNGSKKSETAQDVARQITAEAAAMQAARRSLYSPKADRYVAPMLSPRATGLASDDTVRRYTTPSPRTRQGLSRGRSRLSSARSPLAQREYYKDYHAMHDSPIVAHDYYYSPPASQNVSPRWRSSSSAQRAREELAYLMKSAKAGAASRSGDDGMSHYSHALSQLDSAKVYFGKGNKGRRRSSTREKNKGRHDNDELSSVRHRSDSKKKEKERSEHDSHSTHHTSRKRHDSSASRSRHERHGTKDKKAQRYLLVEPATESTTRSRAPSHTTNSASALSRERHRSPSTSHHHNSHKSRERSRHRHNRSRSTSSRSSSKRRDSSRRNDSKANALSEPVRHTITFGSAPLPRHSVTSVPLLVRDVTNEAKKKEKKDKKEKKKAAESTSDAGHHHHHRDGSRSHRKDDYEERSEKSHNRKEKSRHNSRHHHHHSETDITSSERLTKLDEMIAEWKREEKAANKSKAQTYTGEAHPTSRHSSRHGGRSKESTSHSRKKDKHHHSHHHDKSYSRHKADEDEELRHGSRLRRTASSPGRLTGSSARRVPQSEIRQGEERAQRRRAIRAALQAIRSRPNTESEDPAKFWTPDLIADVKDYYYHGTRLRRGSLGSSLSTSAPSSLNVPTSLLIQRYAALWQQRQAAQRAASPQADHFTDNEYEENENENTKTNEVNMTGPMRSHGPRLSPLPEKLPGAFAQGNLDALVDTPRSGSLNEDHIHGQYRASARETTVNGYPKPSPEMVSVQLDEYDDAGDERPESPQHIETSPASSTVSSAANDTAGVSANRSQLNQRGSEHGAEEEERVVVDTRALLTFARGVCRIVHALENYGEA